MFLKLVRTASAGLLLLVLGASVPARAIPAFSRKSGVACTACHEAWPKLNQQGEAFRDNGYQWLSGTDNTIKLDPAYWPISIRATPGYLYNWQSNQASAAGPRTVQSGRVGTTGIDFLFAGTLTDNISFLMTYEPLLTNVNFNLEFPSQTAAIANPGEGGYLEALWVRIDNLVGLPFLNLKVGLGVLDIPYDEHRSLWVIDSSYGVFHYHPTGTFNPVELGANAWQVSVEGHDDGSRLRYALSYFQSQLDPGSNGPFSSPGVFGNVQYAWFPQRQGLAEVQAGLFGAVGVYPTEAAYLVAVNGATSGPLSGPAADTGGAPGSRANVQQNTGFDSAAYEREGLDVDLKFNTIARPFDLRLMGVMGQESKAFSLFGQNAVGTTLNPTQDALWAGGLAEIDWTPVLNHTIGLRYDFVRNLQTVDPVNLVSHEGEQDTLGLVVRVQLDLLPRTGTAVVLELDRTVGFLSGAGGNTAEQYLAFGGIDFAL